MFGLATSVAMIKCSRCLRASIAPSKSAASSATTREARAIATVRSLVRRLFVRRDFDAVLFLPVADGRLDGVFGEHGTVDLHRRGRKLAPDVRVLDRKRFFNGLALHPLGSEGRAGDGRPATQSLEH